jgi:hypothetical protein
VRVSDYLRDIPYVIETNRPLYIFGYAGCAGYTRKADSDGRFFSFFLKPAGKGARQGTPDYYTYVDRKTSSRKSRIAAKRRSENLAHGKPVTSGVKSKPKKTNPPGSGYCAHCKETVIIEHAANIVIDNGRNMIRGNCPNCHTRVQKFGTLINCPECDTLSEGNSNDYLCKECRASTNPENLCS